MAKPTITAYYLQGSSTTHNTINSIITNNSPEYIGLSYIQSTGTQCFDSGVYGSENIRVVIDFELTNVDARKIFGAVESSGTARNFSYAGAINSSKHGVFFHRANTGTVTNGTVAAAANTRYVYDLNGPAKTVTVNNTTSVTITNDAAGAITRGTMMILNVRQNAAIQTSNGIRAKMYSCKIYENGALIRDFIPVKRSADNAIGVFDKVKQVFCPNVGTGTFTAGDFNTANDLYRTTITPTPINNLKTTNNTQWKKLRFAGWYDGATDQLINNELSYANDNNILIVYDNTNHEYYCKVLENPITISVDNPSFGSATFDVDTITPQYFGLKSLNSHNGDYINLAIPAAEISGFYAKFISHDRLATSDYGCIFGGRHGSKDDELHLTSYNTAGSFRKDTTEYGGNFNAPGTLNEATYASNTYTANGGASTSITAGTYAYNNNMYIYALNNNGTVAQAGVVDLYKLRFDSGGQTVFDFRPVAQKNTLTLGLLNKITGNLHQNTAATNNFSYTQYDYNNNIYKINLIATPENDAYFAGWYNSSNQLISKDKEYILYATPEEFSSLATIYAKFSKINITINVNNVNYGSATGAGGCPVAYNGYTYLQETSILDSINTRLKATNNTRVKCEVENFVRQSGSGWAFGARDLLSNSGSNTYGFLSVSENVYRTDFGSATVQFDSSVSFTRRMIIDKNKRVCTISSSSSGVTSSKTNTAVTFNGSYQMHIMGANLGGETREMGEGTRMYYAQIWENDVLQRDFIPVKKANTNQVGMWDKLNNVFYPSEKQTLLAGIGNYQNNVYGTTLVAQAKAGATFEGWYDTNNNLLSRLPSMTVYPTENTTYEARFFAGEAASPSTQWRVNADGAAIELSGSYINPHVKLSQYPALKIVLEATLKKAAGINHNNNWIVGAVDVNNNYILLGYSATASKFRLQGGVGGSEIDFTSAGITQPHRYVIDYSTGYVSFDNSAGTAFSASSTNTAPILIGASCSTKDSAVYFGDCYVHKVLIYNGTQMIRNLVPFYVDGWGWGLFDKINYIFYPQMSTEDISLIN